jgi:hypothetical protein
MSVASALALATLRVDGAITRRASSSATLDVTFEFGETLGNGWTQATGAIGTFAIGHLTGSPRLQALGADLMRAQALNAILTQGMKVAFDRTRPDARGSRFRPGMHQRPSRRLRRCSTISAAPPVCRRTPWRITSRHPGSRRTGITRAMSRRRGAWHRVGASGDRRAWAGALRDVGDARARGRRRHFRPGQSVVG